MGSNPREMELCSRPSVFVFRLSLGLADHPKTSRYYAKNYFSIFFSNIVLFTLLTDHPQTHCFKDLSSIVTSQLNRRLKRDKVARRYLYQSFGITGHIQPPEEGFFGFRTRARLNDIFVKLLKNVFEALQLYDFADLLPEKPQKARSLRLAVPLQKTADGRPTTYHSSAAVLIIADEQTSNTGGIENFFKGLNSKSDVTIIESKRALEAAFEMIRQAHPIHTEETEETEESQIELENINMVASAVIDRWIHNQGW